MAWRSFRSRAPEELAVAAARRHRTSKGVLGAYCEVGIETAKLAGDFGVYDAASALLKKAEEEVGDPDISRMIARYARRLDNITVEAREPEEVVDDSGLAV